MVWIFGGGFFSGTSTLDVYDGRFLAAKENVIVVSMQYRLGPFGFLYVDPEVQGNMGLWDQHLALQWVQKHIVKFGGDPTKVTLFGESAGAASVTLQYLSPESRPLFQRMIIQSASALNRWALSTKSVAHDAGLAFIKTSDCFGSGRNLKKAVGCLRKLPAETLFDRLYELSIASAARRDSRLVSLVPTQWPAKFLPSAAQYFEVIMRPVLDGDFLPDCPTTLLKSIQEGEAPEALVGNVDKEGMYWLLYGLGIRGVDFLSDEGTVTRPTLDQLKAAEIDYFQLIQMRFMSVGHLVPAFSAMTTAQYGLNSPFVKRIMNHDFGVPFNAISSEVDFLNRLDDLSGEMDFVCGTQLFAKLLAAMKGAKVQYYNFMHKTVGSQFPAWVGAMHGSEIEYVFGMPFSSEFQANFYKFTEDEKNLSAKMMRYWANFARSGNAAINRDGTEFGPSWPEFDGTTQKYMEIDLKQQTMKHHLRNKSCNFWNDDFPSIARAYVSATQPDRLGGSMRPKICPHLEFDLYDVEPLENFVHGADGTRASGATFHSASS
uniref:Carboxylic ester hydrolase n=1 Tax=Mesocestoides corti TaxID=53468 RepID=A0A5K3FVH1_MESCO